MKYIVGVDGGGTKTEAVVCDLNGNVVARKVIGSTNPNDVGNEKMLSSVCGLIESVLPFDCGSMDIGLGISGIFTAGSEDKLLESLKERFRFIDKIKVVSDKDSALSSAYDGDGCIAVIGTGSVCVVRKNGNVRDFGGGGYLIDDALSGFDLGREVLHAVLCADDGIFGKTILTELFNKKTGENIRKHLKYVYLKGKTYVASFAPIVFSALEENDEIAENIMRKSVCGFERLVSAAYSFWGKEQCEMTLFGGLAARFKTIDRFLSEEIKKKVIFKFPEYPIIYGDIKYILSEGKKEFAENFIRSYSKIK
ncbi:MAG: hypothetical protein IJR61_04465 [Clostridia bacterium]|nr:hypothetical protein [Clostridia bacterium]